MARYAAVAVWSARTGRWELMSAGGRVVVFDTARTAWHWLPQLGGGRPCVADARTLSICFTEISTLCPNRARVVAPYDPGERMPWRRHIIWTEWLRGGADGGNRIHE
jgi:hypothetical protein